MPLVYRRCKSANTGKKKRDSTHGVDPLGEKKKKKSGPQLTSLPTPCHFLLKLQFSSYGEGDTSRRNMSHSPPLPISVRKCSGRLQVGNLRLENLPEGETKPARWPFFFSAAPPKSCCIPAPTWLLQPRLGRPQLRLRCDLEIALNWLLCRCTFNLVKYPRSAMPPHLSLGRWAGRRLHSPQKSPRAPSPK